MRHLIIFLGSVLPVSLAHGASDYPIQPVPFTQVHFNDDFWAPRLETNRTVTLPYDFQKCEETGRISNFAKAGGLMEGKHEGIYFNDSDVFKVVEGAAYTLALADDPKLDAYLDNLIAKIVAAQEDDGYLYTARTIDPEHPARSVHPERWGDIKDGHELYNVGHLYEAAVAHYQATGKRNLLDVALKNADLIAKVFGPQGRHDAPGHQEIEIGLTKLYRVTGDKKYLDLAQFFIDQRGQEKGHKLYGSQYQDHLPVLKQKEATGHAVRAGYLYAGMADIAALSGDRAYVDAIDTLWENVVSSKLYLTGGIGARHFGEAFGENYELPNASAYNETCAAVANCLWNHRLFLLHGDGKYMDVFERILYNGYLAGVSLDGNEFFYPNPLESNGVYAFNQGATKRSPWFGTSCCPSNVVRFMPSLPGYAYAVRNDRIYVNLYVAGTAKLTAQGQSLTLRQETRYPWDGSIRITLDIESPQEQSILLRIPGWSMGHPVPSDLYHYTDASFENPTIRVNGDVQQPVMEKGYALLRRTWKKGDVIDIHFDMPVRRVLSDERVVENRGKVALERGPLVYCVEGIDHDGQVNNLFLADDVNLSAVERPDLLNGLVAIIGTARALQYKSDDKGPSHKAQPLTAIPSSAWANREPGKMAVWLARSEATAQA
ncbi:MAG: glycoside hydrolase family 127 protein, partial [Candidatus Hydrogenedentes bacterium]|nr:glycoside hydrolase family 127 protein [Candidatus Hydrogenedentota bacterium]